MKLFLRFGWIIIWICQTLVSGLAQNKTTISFSIPSQGTGLKQLTFHQEIEGVQLQNEDTILIWQLYQKIGNEWKAQLSQVQKGSPNILFGRYDDTGQKDEEVLLQWRQEKGSISPGIQIEDNGKSFDFIYNDSLLLSYRYADMPVPEGVPQVYSRSGFVHPLRTLNGNILTQIQPPDHYHHYGLWHPWTHTEFKGEEIDF